MWRSSFFAGYALAFLFVFLSGTRDIAAKVVLEKYSTELLLLVAFGPTTILAALWEKWKPGRRPPYRREHTRDLVGLNISSLLSWAAAFEAIRLLVPVTFTTIMIGMLPLVTLGLDRMLRGSRIRLKDGSAAMLIVAGVILVSWNEIRSAGDAERILVGIVASLVTSVFAAANNVFAKRLNDRGVSASGVFSARFWMLLLYALVWSVMRGDQTIPTSGSEWLVLGGIGVIGVGFAVMSLQIAIVTIGPRIAGFVIAAIPSMVFVLQIVGVPNLVRELVPDTPEIQLEVTVALVVGVVCVSIGVLAGASDRPRVLFRRDLQNK